MVDVEIGEFAIRRGTVRQRKMVDDSLRWDESAGIWVGDGPLRSVSRVLIIIAHPDDLESQAGGVTAMLTDAGCEVHLVCCTSGDKGSNDRSLTSAEVGPMREREQQDAADFLGIRSVTFLRWPDGGVEPGAMLRESLVRQIRLRRPDALITSDPVNPWPEYTAHRDHRNVGRAALDAVYPDARDHLAFPEQVAEGLEPHKTPEVWLIMTARPNWVVDINGQFERKVQSRLLHRSQTGSSEELRTRYQERAAQHGRPVGLTCAEAFARVLLR
jgi:LmbE family N-acetylglucosaminyl deacetylase